MCFLLLFLFSILCPFSLLFLQMHNDTMIYVRNAYTDTQPHTHEQTLTSRRLCSTWLYIFLQIANRWSKQLLTIEQSVMLPEKNKTDDIFYELYCCLFCTIDCCLHSSSLSLFYFFLSLSMCMWFLFYIFYTFSLYTIFLTFLWFENIRNERAQSPKNLGHYYSICAVCELTMIFPTIDFCSEWCRLVLLTRIVGRQLSRLCVRCPCPWMWMDILRCASIHCVLVWVRHIVCSGVVLVV